MQAVISQWCLVSVRPHTLSSNLQSVTKNDQFEIVRLFGFNKCGSCARIISSNVSIIRFIWFLRERRHKSDGIECFKTSVSCVSVSCAVAQPLAPAFHFPTESKRAMLSATFSTHSEICHPANRWTRGAFWRRVNYATGVIWVTTGTVANVAWMRAFSGVVTLTLRGPERRLENSGAVALHTWSFV